VIRNAKLWCDVESAAQAKSLSKEWDYNLVPGFTASKILWLKENEPQNFQQLAKVLLPHDYFNWYLTGRYCAEVQPLSTAATLPRVEVWHGWVGLQGRITQVQNDFTSASRTRTMGTHNKQR